MKKNRVAGFILNRSIVFQIIVVSVLVYIVQLILGIAFCDPQNSVCKVYDYLALQPENMLAGRYIWTLVSHIFAHGSILHLFVNMFVLFSLGGLCEKIVGRKRFVWFYLVSGVFAGLLSVVLAGFFGYGFFSELFGHPTDYMVGASGAIFALAGLLTVLLPKLRFSIVFFPFFSFPAYVMVPGILVLTWIVSYFAGLNIGNVSHLGGFLSGISFGYYLKFKYPKKVDLLRRIFR